MRYITICGTIFNILKYGFFWTTYIAIFFPKSIFPLPDFSFRASDTYHITIYPYIHQTCNNRTSADQIRAVLIPDVNPSDVPPDLNFSMAAGDFLEVYTEKGTLFERAFKVQYS